MARRGKIGWAQLEVPIVVVPRRGVIGWAVLEVPDESRKGRVGWAVLETPDALNTPDAPGTNIIGGLKSASEALSAWAMVEMPKSPDVRPYMHAMAEALKEVAAQGEPVTTLIAGTAGRITKFAGGTRIADSIIFEENGAILVEGDLVANNQQLGGALTLAAGLSSIIVAPAGGSGTDPTITFRTSQNTRAIIGVPAVANDLVVGSVEGDLVLRVQPGGALKVAVNAGTLVHFQVSTSGIDHVGVHRINGVQVLTTRRTGYAAMTGTANRGTVWDTATITLDQLAQRVKAMQDDHMTHGTLGP